MMSRDDHSYPVVLLGLRTLGLDRIVVTGPQRSGTTIAAQMLAADLGFEFVPEEAFAQHDVGRFAVLLDAAKGAVIQAPAMAPVIHHFLAAVVFMRRDVAAIQRSQQRIGWDVHEADARRWYFRDDDAPIAQLRYEIWERFQRPDLGDRAFDLDYESLRVHPLWVEPAQRAAFGPRQTAMANVANLPLAPR